MPVNRSALLVRRTNIFDRLRGTTGSRMAASFNGLSDYSDEELWQQVASPIITAAQVRAATTQIAYLESVLATRLQFDLAPILERAAVDLRDPFVAFANAIDKGGEFADALTSGAARAEGLGQSAVTYAARSAASTADRKVAGWVRVPEPGACEWCLLVAEQTYHSAESASFGHDRCSCDIDVA